MPSANNTIKQRFVASSDGAGLDNYIHTFAFSFVISKAPLGNTLTLIIMNDPHANLANLTFNGFLHIFLAPVPYDSSSE